MRVDGSAAIAVITRRPRPRVGGNDSIDVDFADSMVPLIRDIKIAGAVPYHPSRPVDPGAGGGESIRVVACKSGPRDGLDWRALRQHRVRTKNGTQEKKSWLHFWTPSKSA